MDTKAPSMLLPAAIAGGSLGFLSGLPYSSCGCCLWAAGAGFLAAFLYSKNCRDAGAEFDTGKGGVLGLLTGAIFGIAGSLVAGTMTIMQGELDAEALREGIENNPMITDPEAAAQAAQMIESVGPMFFVLLIALIWIVLGVLFGAIGGLFGGMAFKVEAAPADPGGGWSSNPPPAAPVHTDPPPPPVAPGDPDREG